MTKNPYAPDFDDLPDVLPIFPLEGVLLLPGGNLPLNIFEPRYLAMVETAMASHRMIGMVQPKTEEPKHSGKSAIYDVGCAGKITEFAETEDGRYLISLTGISRFHVEQELSVVTNFRQINADWTSYKDDVVKADCLDMDREKLKNLLADYFSKNDMDCDWQAIEQADDSRLITCLSMACPLSPSEKQALLEAKDCGNRADLFMTMLQMAICAEDGCAKHPH
ncbi:MAG: LON peptidase substrate-binding domain-containing protein [Pseudomonadota bacterium]